MLQVGIIGTRGSGKSTVFTALTEIEDSHREEPNIGVIKVPDNRLDLLEKLCNPKKLTRETIEFVDCKEFHSALRNASLFLDVIPIFGTFKEPLKFVEETASDMIIRDLEICEERCKKLKRSANPEDKKEYALLEKCKERLEDGIPLRNLEFSPFEEKLLRGFSFLSEKPLILVANLEEGKEPPWELKSYAKRENIVLLSIYGLLEKELLQIEGDDRISMAKEFGIEESGIERFAGAIYKSAGIISFYTVVRNELRAWAIKRGTSALKAAGKIHTDMERGFIKAEVISFEDFKKIGSFQEARHRGLLRLESKDYIVNDGDIIEFKFNV